MEMSEQAGACPCAVHRPVMVAQVLEALDPRPGERALDLTVGTGGHALELAARLGAQGLLVGIDADPGALQAAQERLARRAPCPCRLLHGRFSRALELTGGEQFDLVLADLGIGTHQLDDPTRGFAFESAARPDMRFDPQSGGPCAYDVINRMSECDLADLIYELGQERYSRQIAAAVRRRRETQGPIETTAELCALIKGVAARRSRGRTWRIHPATRTLMALRMFVNSEMGEMDALLQDLPRLLAPGGRAAVLTYHSLEARRVKQAWRRQADEGVLELITRRAVKPSEEEVRDNPRARSAQLRAVRRAASRA
jgi:16S rRNA (cytosine1402-N4)-methyltransferase